MIITKFDKEYDFISMFNLKTGFYIRTSVLNENLEETGTDAFMASYPELMDIGIMGSCKAGKLGICKQAGVYCYQSGPYIEQENMNFEDYKKIIDESVGMTFQVALGGRGDPDTHPDFIEILKYTKEHNIIPNYTTSGIFLTDEAIEATKKYCGAVAISWYKNEYTEKAIQRFLEAKVKTNIHFVLTSDSIDEAIYRVENNKFPKGINAVIFLLYKPVGVQSNSKLELVNRIDKIKKFVGVLNKSHVDFKIGFDSCMLPLLLRNGYKVDLNVIDFCEGARFSIYISPDMYATPCSFDVDRQFAVKLNYDNGIGIKQAWDSEKFELFRKRLFNCNYELCSYKDKCFGKCPLGVNNCNNFKEEIRHEN